MRGCALVRPVSRGFTLIEILVVVVILGVLATFVVPNLMGKPEEARLTKARQDIRALESALQIYHMDNSVFPSTEQGLEALVTKPSGDPEARNWKAGGYLQHLYKDPWGSPYQYLQPGTHGIFDLYSLGVDGVLSDDDLGNWALD